MKKIGGLFMKKPVDMLVFCALTVLFCGCTATGKALSSSEINSYLLTGNYKKLIRYYTGEIKNYETKGTLDTVNRNAFLQGGYHG
jgi:hypothetical protein